MGLLTKAAILAAEDRRYVVVDVPEWGGAVRVGEMSALQRDRWSLEVVRQRDSGGVNSVSVRALVVAYCAVDEQGEPLFAPEDVEALGTKNGRAVDRVFAAAAELNVLTDKAAEDQRGN